MRRFIVAVSAVACIAAGAVGLGGPASAASGVSCKTIKGTITTTITITACTPKVPKGADASASAPASSLATGGTLTWSKSGQTTVVALTVSGGTSQGGCAKKWIEYDANGTVTGGNSTYTQVGDVVSARACVGPTGALKLVAHTVMTL